MTAKHIVPSLLAALLATACGERQPVPAAPAQSQATGDLAPSALFSRPVAGVARDELRLSLPASPRDHVAFPEPPYQEVSTDAIVIVPAGAAGTYQVPVDSPEEGTLYLAVRGQPTSETLRAALRSIQVLSPDGAVVNSRRSAEDDLVPMSAISLSGHPAGLYTVVVGQAAADLGLALEVRQPRSMVALSLSASTSEVLLGDDASAQVVLEGDGLPVAGARVAVALIAPDGDRRDLAAEELGPGAFRVALSVLGQDDEVGAYTIEATASGTTAAGLPFVRSARTSFHYGVPTARIVAVSPLRTVTEGEQVTALEADVTLEVASLDRYEVSATLAGRAADQTERRVGEAQTALALDAGRHVVTLRFDAGFVQLTRLEGSFSLRNLTLFSQGTNTLYHRVGYGMGAISPKLRHAQLAQPRELPPMVQQMIEDRAFDLR